MSRKKKILKNSNQVDIREIGYYSTPDFLVEFISKEMEVLGSGDTVFDPCTGKEELLYYFNKKKYQIDSIDVFAHKKDYFSNFFITDFFSFYENNKNLDYDYYISNPPYNCHESDYMKNNKSKLDSLFGNMGGNLYAYFVSGIINMAKEGSVIGLVLPDTFLTLKGFSAFREKVLRECSVHKIIMCPKRLFVDQGANVTTCVLILQKGNKYQGKIGIINRTLGIDSFRAVLMNEKYRIFDVDDVFFKLDDDFRILIDVDKEIYSLFEGEKIEDLYECLCGVATGNDKVYLSKTPTDTHSIPFYKNPGKKKFTTFPNAYLYNDFLEESRHVKTLSVSNKNYYFKEGITCSLTGVRFSACVLPEGSVFSLNPNIFLPKNDIYWMISYLNSDLVLYLLRNVIIRSNVTTSGYVSKIPVLKFTDEEKKCLENICLETIEGDVESIESQISKINKLIYEKLEFNQEVISKISFFVKNINKMV